MADRSMYTKSLGQAVANRAKGSGQGKFHIISSGTAKWVVVPEGAVKPIRSFLSRKSAVTFALEYAVTQAASEIVVHGKDGSIANRIAV